MKFSEIVQRLDKPRPYKVNKGQYIQSVRARCPSCGGSLDKLCMTEMATGQILVNCYAGCSFLDIVNALGLVESDFFPPKENSSNSAKVKIDSIKGWEWWSLASALDVLHEKLKCNFIELVSHLPGDDPSRAIMSKAISEIKNISERLKYGKEVTKL